MFHKKICRFDNANKYFDSTCSKQPIVVGVRPSKCIDPTANLTFRLPKEYGKPYVRSCLIPCSTTKPHEIPESHLYEMEARLYTFNLNSDSSEMSEYKIGVTGHSCRDEVCTYQFNSSFFENCSEEPFLPGDNNLDGKVVSSKRIGSILAPVSLAVFLLVVVVFYTVKRRVKSRRNAMKSSFTMLSRTSSLFLVFRNEKSKYKDAVLKFATFLKADFGLNVRLDLYDQENVYDNPAAWLEQSLTSDIVLVIWSPGDRDCWLNQNNYSENLDLLIPALRHIKSDMIMKRNVTKYIFAYFDYNNSSCDDVIPNDFRYSNIHQYRLPSQCSHLLYAIMKPKQNIQVVLNRKITLKELINEKLRKDTSGYYTAFTTSIAKLNT